MINYKPAPGDFEIYNPYLHEVLSLIKKVKSENNHEIENYLLKNRHELISKYSFAIPVEKTLKIIMEHSPVIEIGAGTGYWAMCLIRLGVDIIAFDNKVPGDNDPWCWYEGNLWHDDTWHYVQDGDEKTAGLYPERSLFLCWPEPQSNMASESLKSYLNSGGETLIFAGAPFSCGDDEFHKMRRALTPVVEFEMPGWPGIDEIFGVYKKTIA